ncbi:MAG: TolC family protein [Terriglobia bacterium]|jgi:outer membrane protein TolC
MKRFGIVFVVWLFMSASGSPAQAPQEQIPPASPDAAGTLTLKEAVNLALKHNPSIQAADAYADAVRRGMSIAASGRYPRLDFSEGVERGNNPVYVFSSLLTERRFTQQNFTLSALNFPTPIDNFRTQFAASAPLYDAGQTVRRVRDARLDAQGAERALQRTSQEIIFSVIQSYTDELLARESVRVAEAAVRSTGEDLARAQSRQEQGQALLSDVLLAKVQLAQAQEELIRAHNSEAIAQAALNVAMGAPEDSPHRVEGALAETTFEAGILEERQKRALAARPDYQQTLIGREKAANGISQARAEFLPTLNTFATWEVDSQTFAARGGNDWIAGASLNFNLFDGGARRARVGQARARERQAEAVAAQMASAIRLQVREAFLNLDAARQRVEVSRQSADQAQESLRILQDRYEASLATITDVLGAETAHDRAQRDYLNAVFDYRISYAALELATGELSADSQAVVQQ